MNIRELHCEPRSNSFVVVSLSYEECRDIANGLYEAYCLLPVEDKKRYKTIYEDTTKLFEIVKTGWCNFDWLESEVTENEK